MSTEGSSESLAILRTLTITLLVFAVLCHLLRFAESRVNFVLVEMLNQVRLELGNIFLGTSASCPRSIFSGCRGVAEIIVFVFGLG